MDEEILNMAILGYKARVAELENTIERLRFYWQNEVEYVLNFVSTEGIWENWDQEKTWQENYAVWKANHPDPVPAPAEPDEERVEDIEGEGRAASFPVIYDEPPAETEEEVEK